MMTQRSKPFSACWPSLYFGNLSAYIDHYEQRPVGMEGQNLPVAILKTDCFQPKQVIGSNGQAKTGDDILEGLFGGCKIVFQHLYEAAFVRKAQKSADKPKFNIPINTYHLRQAGGYRLSQLLGLSNIPQTELVDMPGVPLPTPKADTSNKSQDRRLHEFWNAAHIFGTIQSWVNGRRLDDMYYAFDGATDNLRRMRHKLYEAYIYAVVAWDPDQHGGNVLERDSDGHMELVDTNLSGADPENTGIQDVPLQYDIQNTDIPSEYLNGLRNFVENYHQNREILSAYYGQETAKQMIERARYLIQHPTVTNMRTIRERLINQ